MVISSLFPFHVHIGWQIVSFLSWIGTLFTAGRWPDAPATAAATAAARAAALGLPEETAADIHGAGRDDEQDDAVFNHDSSPFYPSRSSVPIWYTATARLKAKTVLKAMEKSPHFQEPDSRTMQTTVTKQGA